MAKDKDYKVGRGKPPKSGQFQKGQSGNLKGRPKGSKNFSTDLKEELQKMIPIRENGRIKKVSKQRAMLKRLLEKALQGDVKAAIALATLIHRHIQDVEETAVETSTPLSKTDAEILAEFEAEIRRKPPPEPTGKKPRRRERPIRSKGKSKSKTKSTGQAKGKIFDRIRSNNHD